MEQEEKYGNRKKQRRDESSDKLWASDFLPETAGSGVLGVTVSSLDPPNGPAGISILQKFQESVDRERIALVLFVVRGESRT